MPLVFCNPAKENPHIMPLVFCNPAKENPHIMRLVFCTPPPPPPPRESGYYATFVLEHWDRRAIQPNHIKFRTSSALAPMWTSPINESAELTRGPCSYFCTVLCDRMRSPAWVSGVSRRRRLPKSCWTGEARLRLTSSLRRMCPSCPPPARACPLRSSWPTSPR
jgi:hypothetical protein